MRKFKRKRLIGVLAGIAVLAMAGAAVAYFTSTGNGTGSASVGSSTGWKVTSSTAGGPLYPGVASTDQTVTVHVKNTGSGNQSLSQFTIMVANADGSAWTSSTTAFPGENACSASDFALGTNTAAGVYQVNHSVDSTLPDDLAPGATYTTTVNLHMLDTQVPQDNCQGVTPPLYIGAS